MRHRVFVSIEESEVEQYLEIVREVLLKLGFDMIDGTVMPPRLSPVEPFHSLIEALESTDIFVGIYGNQYGEVLNEQDISLAELIFEEASRLNLPRYVYVIAPHSDRAMENLQTDFRGALMRMFLNHLEESTLKREFSTVSDLTGKITFDLARFYPRRLSGKAFSRRHFLIGMLIVWLLILGSVLLVSKLV